MKKFHYLLRFQYLGFRYHGWQKQPQVKTVQFMLDRTLEFILGHGNLKTLGASRTDSMVSAMNSACTITIKDDDVDPDYLFKKLNENLPADIKALSLERVDEKFQVINHAKLKTYYYLFSNEQKAYPFAAPYMCNIVEKLDIELMKEGAKLFEGMHHFKAYCYKPTPGKVYDREIVHSRIEENNLLEANFFPPETFLYTVKGEGFMRHQIRLMVGALFRLGRGEKSLEDIRNSLIEEAECIGFVAPASGLILGDLQYK